MVTAFFTLHPCYSLHVPHLLPLSCFPVSFSTLLLVFPSHLFWELFGCVVGCGMWQWKVLALLSARSWVSSAWLSRLSGIFTSGFGSRELSVATCCAGSSRTPHVEDRVSKRLKIKPSEFILLSKWGRPVLYKMANGGVPQSFSPLCSPFLLLKAWCTVLLKQFGQHFKMSLFLKALWVHLFIILGRAGW